MVFGISLLFIVQPCVLLQTDPRKPNCYIYVITCAQVQRSCLICFVCIGNCFTVCCISESFSSQHI
uniref:Secreted protein n=1 Tax=Physcomitrium patens TaxID=3218 RepID=A0A2K1I9X5_PHYPA|nr:hypothetical protein PHYPA_031154 [Physcomitrium patens]